MKKAFIFLILFRFLICSADVFSMHGKNYIVSSSSGKCKQHKKPKSNQKRKTREKTIRNKKQGGESCCQLAFLGLCATLGATAGNLVSSSITKDNTIIGAAAGFGTGIYLLTRNKARKVKTD